MDKIKIEHKPDGSILFVFENGLKIPGTPAEILLYYGLKDVLKELGEIREALDTATFPHAVFKPSLVRLGKNGWSATYGNLGAANLFGKGKTPAEAIADFNRKFFEEKNS